MAHSNRTEHFPAQWMHWGLSIISLVLAGCGTGTREDTGCSGQAIMGGASIWPDAGTASSADGLAYVWVVDKGPNVSAERLCTLTRSAPGKGITAAHCIGASGAWDAWVGFGPVAASPSQCASTTSSLFRVTRHTPNLGLDLDILEFEDPGGPTLRLAKVVPNLSAAVILAGYGLNESGTFGEKRYAESTVVARDEDTITVYSGGRSGACVGDSGGPLLTRDEDGEYTVAGVLEEGSLSCKGQDVYISLVPVEKWLNEAGAF